MPRRRPKDPPPAQHRWVVLIHMAATTPDLREIMQKDLDELAARLELLQGDQLRVYALLESPDGKYAARHALHGRRRGGPPPFIMRLDRTLEPRLGRKGALLSRFIKWRFTSEEEALKDVPLTLLVLWGHSQGVAAALSKPGSPAYAQVGRGGFGYDEITGDSLSLPQIRRAIANGLEGTKRRIDVLSFDSCFMSAAEVSAEFQGAAPPLDRFPGETPAEFAARGEEQKPFDQAALVDYVVASQTAVLLDGLDYGRLIDAFIESDPPGLIDPVTLGRRLLEQASSTTRSPQSLSLLNTGYATAYDDFRAAFGRLVTQLSLVLDTGQAPPSPNTAFERLRAPRLPANAPAARGAAPAVVAPALANRSEWLRIRDAFENATWHKVRQFIDLGDLCRRLANNCRTRDLRLAAIDVLRTLQLPGSPPTGTENAGHESPKSLVVDVRSLSPLLLSGVSLYCPWLFPTPEDTRRGAWNAVVDLFDYATDLWFNRGAGSWGTFLYHAKHVLAESRQRAVNTEIADLRLTTNGAAGARHADTRSHGPASPASDAPEAIRASDKPGNDLFTAAEPPAELAASVGQNDRVPFNLTDRT